LQGRQLHHFCLELHLSVRYTLRHRHPGHMQKESGNVYARAKSDGPTDRRDSLGHRQLPGLGNAATADRSVYADHSRCGKRHHRGAASGVSGHVQHFPVCHVQSASVHAVGGRNPMRHVQRCAVGYGTAD
ncbi:hypothetical protein B0A49_13932, partial [Cryomyces minteri]